MAVIERFGIASALAGLDGELRAKGVRADGSLRSGMKRTMIGSPSHMTV